MPTIIPSRPARRVVAAGLSIPRRYGYEAQIIVAIFPHRVMESDNVEYAVVVDMVLANDNK